MYFIFYFLNIYTSIMISKDFFVLILFIYVIFTFKLIENNYIIKYIILENNKTDFVQ